jgi:hypothetical protein
VLLGFGAVDLHRVEDKQAHRVLRPAVTSAFDLLRKFNIHLHCVSRELDVMGEDGARRDDAPFSSLGCHRVTERWHAQLNNEALDAAPAPSACRACWKPLRPDGNMRIGHRISTGLPND